MKLKHILKPRYILAFFITFFGVLIIICVMGDMDNNAATAKSMMVRTVIALCMIAIGVNIPRIVRIIKKSPPAVKQHRKRTKTNFYNFDNQIIQQNRREVNESNLSR